LLRFKLAQMCYRINTETTRPPTSFLIFYAYIHYIIKYKSTYKNQCENSHMLSHIEIHMLKH
jgi:hypothetical protein